MKRKAPIIIVSLLWVLAIASLVYRHFGTNEQTALFNSQARGTGKQWASIYLKGQKIGYMHSLTQKTDTGYNSNEYAYMKLNVMSVQKEIIINTTAALDGYYKLLSFDFMLESDVDMHIKGNVKDGVLSMTIESAGVQSKQDIQLSDEPYLSSSLPDVLRGIDLSKEGQSIKVPVFDPSAMKQDYALLKVVGRERASAMGRVYDAYRLNGTFMSADFDVWITDEGEIIKEESMGITYLRDTKDSAPEIWEPSVDLISDMSLPFNMRLPDNVASLKVRLSGADLRGLELDGGNQSLTGDILEINAQYPKRTEHDDVLKTYLADSTFIDFKDPRIMKLANEITSNASTNEGKARLIYEWVFKKIAKVPSVTIPKATAVLEAMQGDCNEHSTLYTALSRASGLPARIAVGLVHTDGRFYYHAWPEVYIDGWTAIDPTLGQYPADAAHIRMSSGDIDAMLKLSNVIGRLKIEGISYNR